MVATRSMSGTTKKASDTKKAVNHKVGKTASKKTSAITTSTAKEERDREREERDRERDERRIMEQAREFFVERMFLPLFLQNNPDVIYTLDKRVEIMSDGDKEWDSMTDKDKAPYVSWAKKRFDHLQLYRQGLCGCH